MTVTATKNILSGLLRIKNGLALSSTLQTISDDLGTDSLLKLSTLQGAIGTAFTNGYFANAKFVSNQYASVSDEGHNIGIFGAAQATLNSSTVFGYGLYGHGYTNGSARSGGVVGEGKVTATGDTGSAIGLRGYATDTHAGGMNIGLYSNAAGGASNYALYMDAGDIKYTPASTIQLWETYGLRLSSTAPTSATASLFGLGSAIAAGSASGTYFGVNSTSGFAGDFANWQKDGVLKFKFANDGSSTQTLDVAHSYFITKSAANTIKFRTADTPSSGVILAVYDSYNYTWLANGSNMMKMEATGSLSIGGSFSNGARVHIKGDGTNPILRLDNSAGTQKFAVSNSGQINPMTTAARTAFTTAGVSGYIVYDTDLESYWWWKQSTTSWIAM